MQQFYGGPQGYAAAQAAAARGGYPGQPNGYPGQAGGPPQQQRGGQGPPGQQQRYAPPGQMPMPQGYGYPGGYPPPRGPFPQQGQQPGQPGAGPQQASRPPQQSQGRPNGVPPQQQAQQRGAGGLNAQALAAASPADRKQLLGEALYPQIHASEPELAGKITGMLLEMDDSELIQLIGDQAALNEKVSEAKDVLVSSPLSR